MKRSLALLILVCLCPIALWAQKITVSGLIMDGDANEPLTGASVVLLTPKDSTQVVGAASNQEGKFTLPSVKSGRYILRVSFMGFISQYKNMTLTKSEKTVDAGTITLREDSRLMKETEVVAKIAQMEMKADTFVYNADAFRLPEGSNLEELVKKLPGAEVDEDGTIRINGKTVSKIMVEGKDFFEGDTKMTMKNPRPSSSLRRKLRRNLPQPRPSSRRSPMRLSCRASPSLPPTAPPMFPRSPRPRRSLPPRRRWMSAG